MDEGMGEARDRDAGEDAAEGARLRVVDPLAAAMARGRRIRYEDGDRCESLLRAGGGAGICLEVSARSAAGRETLRQEAEVLALLAERRVRAAPRLIDVQADGYLRETGRPLCGGSGRRIDRDGAPAPEERAARARAREDMDALLEALHEVGHVLGLEGAAGLAARGDGSVLVDDLRGLRRSAAIADRLADQRWLDSVLDDQGRTLRRRIDEAAPAVAPESPGGPAADSSPWLQEARSAARPRAAEAPASAAVPGGRADGRSALPDGRRRGARNGVRRRGGRGRGGRRRVAAILAGAGALVAFLVPALVLLGAPPGGTDPGTQGQPPAASVDVPAPDAAPSEADGPSAAAAPSEAAVPVPSLEDPRSVLTGLAQQRHDYVLGVEDDSAAAPGSPAEAEDEEVREGYRGSSVQGWRTVIHGASVRSEDPDTGTVVLEATIEESAHTVLGADGARRDVPGSGIVPVRVELQPVHGAWRIREVTPL
ncbi:hypothetical protein BF93_06490 [Brachybacterium phenoliresistens]|uniref:Uncharacterized protein n=2 Tax=Brachybacterium phenoliresistens TaxID=396014 RepID=Z9JYU2_9MICO|nr:hypothetical protein BF93_06490 [Brachybacterium phenoliresistens]